MLDCLVASRRLQRVSADSLLTKKPVFAMRPKNVQRPIMERRSFLISDPPRSHACGLWGTDEETDPTPAPPEAKNEAKLTLRYSRSVLKLIGEN